MDLKGFPEIPCMFFKDYCHGNVFSLIIFLSALGLIIVICNTVYMKHRAVLLLTLSATKGHSIQSRAPEYSLESLSSG